MALMNKEGVMVSFAVVASVTLLIALLGNFFLLLFSYERRAQCSKIQKLLIRSLALANLITAVFAVPCNIAYIRYQYRNDAQNASITCILRYLFTFSSSCASVMSLTALCIHRKDKVTKIPFGLNASIRENNMRTVFKCIWIFSVVPTAIFTVAYILAFKIYRISPCQPMGTKKTINFYIGLAKGIFIATIFATNITLIVRAARKIKIVVRRCRTSSRNSSFSQQNVNQRRANAVFYYAATFVSMWAPFAFITVFAGQLPNNERPFAFTLGYTFAHISVAVLPVFHALTDTNFKLFVKRGMRGPGSNRVSFQSFFTS